VSVFKADGEGVMQEVSRETVKTDIEGYRHHCVTCGRDANLVPIDWDTTDWAKVVCPLCFTDDWIEVYS